MKKTQLSLSVNGQTYTLDPIPGETLADLLRKRLKLTGTKIGCNEAECGACTVILDGEPVLSCSYPAERADGKTILTIEGIGPHPNPSPASGRGAHLPGKGRHLDAPSLAGSLRQTRRGAVWILHPWADYDFVCAASEKAKSHFGRYSPCVEGYALSLCGVSRPSRIPFWPRRNRSKRGSRCENRWSHRQPLKVT